MLDDHGEPATFESLEHALWALSNDRLGERTWIVEASPEEIRWLVNPDTCGN